MFQFGEIMSALIQYDLFDADVSEVEKCRKEIEAVRVSGDRVRRGTYAGINELKKRCYDLECRLEILEKYICKVE